MPFRPARTGSINVRAAARITPSRPTRDAGPLIWTGLVLAAALALMASPLVSTAQASTALQRCIGTDGTPVYTDKPCAMFDAQRTPMSGELLGRIAREQRAHAVTPGDFDGSPRATPAVARRSAAAGCARTPTQLTMDVQGAWALGDVNRIAESYHWVGLNHRQGQQIMQRLDRLAAQPLLHAEYFDARIGSGAMQFADAGGGAGGAAGILQAMFADGGAQSVHDFEVELYRGCYFIRF